MCIRDRFFLRGFSPKRFIDPATDLPPRVVLPEPFGVALHVPFQPVIPYTQMSVFLYLTVKGNMIFIFLQKYFG